MKKPAKISLGIVIIIAILFFFGLHTPFLLKGIKKQIRPGQSIEQVLDVLNRAGKKPDLCCWEVQGIEDYLCSDPKTCKFPADQIQVKGMEQTRLTVLFMGPGFMHNDFHITFNSDGLVASISDVKQWD